MIVWSALAEAHLQEIYDYIFQKSPQNAEMVVNELVLLANSLYSMPYKNPKEPTYNLENVRFVPKWNYKIIYSVDDGDIKILSIFNTSQGFMKKTK